MTSQQSVSTKIIARLRHVLGHCRENDAFTRKVIVDFIVVDLAFCKHIKLEFIWFVMYGYRIVATQNTRHFLHEGLDEGRPFMTRFLGVRFLRTEI